VQGAEVFISYGVFLVFLSVGVQLGVQNLFFSKKCEFGLERWRSRDDLC
jgi:hypothetical protein